jgi:hypothetical protein
MNRTQILERIAELDRQINQKVDKNRVPSLNLKHRSFPAPSWVSAIVLAALWIFGGQFFPPLGKPPINLILLGLTGLSLLFALYRTFMWLIKGRVKLDKKYEAGMKDVMGLQQERQALQKQLDAMDKK